MAFGVAVFADVFENLDSRGVSLANMAGAESGAPSLASHLTPHASRYTSAMHNELLIGLVSISDRASSGVYEDKGLPALQE